MDQSLLHIIWTVVAMAIFVLIGLWAYWGRNRARFDEAARMPLDDDKPLSPAIKQENNNV